MARIVVSGGAGFIGSHLCDQLLEQGHEVVAVDNLFTGTKRNIQKLISHPRFDFIRHDVTQPIWIECDEVYHLACPASPVHYHEKSYPQLRYKPDHIGQAHFDGSRYIHAYFDTIIDTKDSATGGGSDRYLSEDYMFCQLWRKIGGEIYLCPWMKTQHIGTYAFTGNMPKVAELTGKL